MKGYNINEKLWKIGEDYGNFEYFL